MDLRGETHSRPRTVGDYIIGPRIGSGSFADVWKSRHRLLATEFAIKEIDKKHLNENMLKEISILRRINHPNIIRLFDAIETEDKIFLVLEYCEGGDLGGYLNRHGRASMDVARHFMRQLAEGLKVLHDNNLIHRDLKPQNLLLSSKGLTPQLKIGDFGFARYLTPQGLADTLCGSPLYMAPEIIQNQKYDAKADLWSVGAILFQLGMGKPPYCGNSQFELFQNILSSSELQFPEAALQALNPDFVELCRKLLRQNPVERLTFEEFFNHNFLMEPRVTKEPELQNPVSKGKALAESCSRDEELCNDHGHQFALVNRNKTPLSAYANDEIKPFLLKDPSGTSRALGGCGFLSCTTSDTTKHSADVGPSTSNYRKVDDSMELIERGYVLVHSHSASMESLTSSLERTLIDSTSAGACGVVAEKSIPTAAQVKEIATSSIGRMDKTSTIVSNVLMEGHRTGDINPSTRLQLLHRYARALSVVAQEKLNARSLLESLSVQLAVLAIWKEVNQICVSWLVSSTTSCKETLNQEGVSSNSTTEENVDFSKPSAALLAWAESEFVVACEHAEELAKHLQETDGTDVIPNAIRLVYQTALSLGISAAVDELMENRGKAAMSYSRAMLLLSFIISEAPLLSLNPPFSMHPDDKERVLNYIRHFECHKNRLRALQHSSSKQPFSSANK